MKCGNVIKQPFEEIKGGIMLIGILLIIFGTLLVFAGSGSFALTTIGSCISIGLIVVGCVITVASLH